MKQSFVWIKTVMPALRQLQTCATTSYITATTGERKSRPKVKCTFKWCCNAYSYTRYMPAVCKN